MVYTGAVPLDTDVLLPQRATMLGLGGLASAVLGTGPTVDGLDVTPTTPTSLRVNVAPGAIYASAAVDALPFGSLEADTAHSTVKQGLLADAQQLPITPPSTPGYSQVFLVQAAFQEAESGATVLPYYNSANPSQAWSGPGNSGQQQYTRREGRVVLQTKAGTPAPTGSQQSPAPDPGWAGLAYVTTTAGQAVIQTSNIAKYSGPHRIPRKLPSLGRVAGSAVTVVTGSRALTMEEAGLVILDAGAWVDSITVTLPRISDAPTEPVRFRFVNRYITPRSRTNLSWVRIQPASGDAMDEPWIYCGPNDTVEVVSNGVNRWIWASDRHVQPLVLSAVTGQTVPSGVTTALQWQPPSVVTMDGWITPGQSTIIRMPRYSRYRFSGTVTFSSATGGTRLTYLMVNNIAPTSAGYPWATMGGATNAVPACLNFSSGGIGMVDGDQIQVVAYQDSGVALTIDATRTWFSVELVA
jgi:hypothetical protein